MKLSAVIALLVLSLTAGLARAETITLLADEWCPYNCEERGGKPGYMVEIARQVFEKAGHKVVYKTMNWTRSILEAREGRATGVIGASKEGEAAGFVFPDKPQGKGVTAILVKKGNPWRYDDSGSVEPLKALSLGVIQDYDYGDWTPYLKSAKGDAKKVQAVSGDNALELNLKKLVAGRVDAVLEDRNVAEYALGDLKLADQVEIAGVNPKYDELFIAFSPKEPKAVEYARLLVEGVEDLRRSGELAAILKGYSLKDWR